MNAYLVHIVMSLTTRDKALFLFCSSLPATKNNLSNSTGKRALRLEPLVRALLKDEQDGTCYIKLIGGMFDTIGSARAGVKWESSTM